MDDRIQTCMRNLGHRFVRPELLATALRHPSSVTDETESNQRMEFLGDAVLSLVVSHYLFERFPDRSEGELTRMKSLIVSRQGLVQVAGYLDIQPFLELGRGITSGEAPLPESILADALEAVIGAIYLDGGFGAARAFILNHFEDEIDTVLESPRRRNYKSILQHLCQIEHSCVPTYVIRRELGPDHSKQFEVQVLLGDHEGETAWGRTKKEAEQLAAMHSLMRDFPDWHRYDL
jgi:ribonuclease-3